MIDQYEKFPTQKISLAIEEFTDGSFQEMIDILRSDDGKRHIASLKFSKGLFEDRAAVEELSPYYRSIEGHLYPIIADISLSGGYADSVRDIHSTVRRNGFYDSTFTLSRIPQDEIVYIRDYIVPIDDKTDIKLLLTGGLPENSSADFAELFKMGKRKFTEEKVRQARELGLFGVYASAGLIPADPSVFTLGAGISFDGEPYLSDGVPKKSVTVERALENCSQFVVGRVLFHGGRSIQENFAVICEKIDEFVGQQK